MFTSRNTIEKQLTKPNPLKVAIPASTSLNHLLCKIIPKTKKTNLRFQPPRRPRLVKSKNRNQDVFRTYEIANDY
jgi:hypothetical protein